MGWGCVLKVWTQGWKPCANTWYKGQLLNLSELPLQLIQSLSHVQLFPTPWTAAHQGFPVHHQLRELAQTHVHQIIIGWCPSNHLILCHPLLFLPSIFPNIRVFSNESVLCIRWPNYCSFSFSISPSNEYSGLISFKVDWFDLLMVHLILCLMELIIVLALCCSSTGKAIAFLVKVKWLNTIPVHTTVPATKSTLNICCLVAKLCLTLLGPNGL